MSQRSTRLYLILPPIADAAAFKPILAAALGAGDIACVLLQSGPDLKATGQALVALIQEHDAALLVAGDPRLVARIGADGVHVAYSQEAVGEAVSSLGSNGIVGVGALATRDDSMSAGAAGASYVMFGEADVGGQSADPELTLERVGWWAEIFNVPCVGYAGTLDEIGPLAEAGAEFVALGDAVWQHPAGPADAIKQANAILANAVLTA